MDMRGFIDLVETLDYDEWTPERGIDEFVRTEFMTGGCYALAVALHDKTGWPIQANFDAYGDVNHVWVIRPDGAAVDINGVHDTSVAKTKYDLDGTPPSGPEPYPADDPVDQDMLAWARQLIDGFPDHFGL